MGTKNHRSEEPLTLGPFLQKLEKRLQFLTPDRLREVLLRHARELTAKERENFLAIFLERDEPVIKPVYDPELIPDINSFIKDLENGEYCDGWGYDREIGEERAFGDETWTVEMDDLFDRAADVFLSGNRSLAAEAYGLLLHAFDLEEEGMAFSGPESPDCMIDTDVTEAKARYFRSLYETVSEEERVARLLMAMITLQYTGSSRMGMKAILEADDKPLSDFDAFLTQWLQALKEEKPDQDHWRNKLFQWLLREAMVLSEGTKGLAELAEEQGDRHPEVYFDWVLALMKEKKLDKAIAAAKKGVDRILNPDKKARLADQLAAMAIGQGDEELCFTARRQAWRAAPTIKRLLLFCGANDPDNDEIDKRLKTEFTWCKKSANKPDKRLTAILQLLVGEYETPLAPLTKTKALGWSNHQHPGPVVFPFLLLAGSGVEKPKAGSVMADFFSDLDSLEHEELMPDLFGDDLRSPEEHIKLSHLFFLTLKRYPLKPGRRNEFLRIAKNIALKRICAIVSNKHRRAYERAARVLIGCVEALELAGKSKEGESLIQKVKEEFPRHSAFWRELRSLTGGKKRLNQSI